MPNFLYAGARTKFLWGGIAWTTNTFQVMFLGTPAVGGSGAGMGTTGFRGFTNDGGPYVADINLGWRSRGGTTANWTTMDLDSKFYFSPTGVKATTFDTVTRSVVGVAYTIDGEARGADLTFGGVAQSYQTLSAFVIYRDKGAAENNNDLIAFFDTATNLPIPANGGDITIQWSTNPNYIFKL